MLTNVMAAFARAVVYVTNHLRIGGEEGELAVGAGVATLDRMNRFANDAPECMCHMLTNRVGHLLSLFQTPAVPWFQHLDDPNVVPKAIRMATRVVGTCSSKSCRALFDNVHEIVSSMALPPGVRPA